MDLYGGGKRNWRRGEIPTQWWEGGTDEKVNTIQSDKKNLHYQSSTHKHIHTRAHTAVKLCLAWKSVGVPSFSGMSTNKPLEESGCVGTV